MMVLSWAISYKQKPHVRDVADRDVFILKPDECILKPDKKNEIPFPTQSTN